MAVAGINNVSVLETSYLGENYSPISRRWGNQERPITRTSFIRKMWRELEGENRFRETERQPTNGTTNSNIGSQCSCSSEGTESENASITTSEVENECPRDQNLLGLQNEEEDNRNSGFQSSPALGLADKQRVRQVFREWGSKHSSGRSLNVSHKNNCSRAQSVCENECKRVRTVRQWIESNTQQAELGNSGGFGARRPIRRLYGRQALLDLLTRFQRERKQEMQMMLETRPVSTFAHRNRIQALLRGRFLWNQRFVQDEKSTSTAASELGLLRQTQTVSDLRKGFLSKLDNDEHVHDGSHSDTSSDNGMKYHQENMQELPDEIFSEVETTNITTDIGQTNKVDLETDICGSPGDNIDPVEEADEQVIEDEGRQQSPPPTELIDDNQQTLELECATMDDQDHSDGEEVEVHETFEHLDRSETNLDSLSWQEGSRDEEAEEENDVIEWHRLTNSESNSIENEDDEWYQETTASDIQEAHDGWYDNQMEEDTTETWFGEMNSYPEASSSVVRRDVFYTCDDESGNRLELQQLMSRRRVSNLLQSDFRGRLDQLIQSYVERQEHRAPESDDEWMLDSEQQDQDQNQDHDQHSVDENDYVTEAVETTEDPVIPQTPQFVTDWEIINGLRFDMVSLQERMNEMQRTLETCMNMQVELQRSVQQEVSSALNRSFASGEGSLQKDAKEDCYLCCDSGFDSTPDRCVYVCSKCAVKIDWSKLKESVTHP